MSCVRTPQLLNHLGSPRLSVWSSCVLNCSRTAKYHNSQFTINESGYVPHGYKHIIQWSGKHPIAPNRYKHKCAKLKSHLY